MVEKLNTSIIVNILSLQCVKPIFAQKIKMAKWFLSFVMMLCFSVFTANAQPAGVKSQADGHPKLVVGIVIDQMRWDYLYRFGANYGPDGFKRLLNQGFSFDNTLIPYTPTYTAAGHACVYTGSVPAIHGIMGNNWFDRNTGTNVYCTDDSIVKTLGSASVAGKMSPRNMWATTITDELRLSNNFQSKVIGIALKDRGAILPAGHSANGAYWYDDLTGNMITSTYYMDALPAWVNHFNAKKLPSAYMGKDWTTLLDKSKYVLSTEDDKAYENVIPGETSPVFPHRTSTITKNPLGAFRTTPGANSYTFDFAKAAVDNENLGSGSVTDFLAVSISSTDYIGHTFGPNSIEVEDTYYRLDKDIAAFLQFLDNKLGKGNYLVFLTADHGVAHVPAFLQEHKIPAGTFDDYGMMREINSELESEFGVANILQSIQNYQFYINYKLVAKTKASLAEVKRSIIRQLMSKPFVVNAFETEKLFMVSLPETQRNMMINGYNPVRSGDIMFTVKPGYFDGGTKGTTHGLWNPYDAHIPNLWFGWHIPHGRSHRETYMTDISPTIAALLSIQMPNGSVGKVLTEVVE